ncbi:DEAD/DEAH box helicase [Segetibacter aerophilus]|uniref:Helicase SNF n=1 Tax=Segetibacter aerophilus TaxID=670293 RepID=A0A512BIQ1_9BACT|nr:DEAD/DEAH box helicase [Segetibacter aerophilus]GEO11844.1 helicase SNF [Segetibacter aerophilus]
MAELDVLKNFQEQILQQEKFTPLKDSPHQKLIVVLKQHRFYKQLCIELYNAATTKAGKLKNPLTIVNPLDIVWKTNEPDELKFFSGVARFQNNATASKSAADIDALKAVIKNPLTLSFFYHNPELSKNVVAGSIVPVKVGWAVNDLQLFVNKKQDVYELSLEIKAGGTAYDLNDVEVKHDYFVLIKDNLYLLGKFDYVQVVQLFKQYKGGLIIHEAKYKEFHQETLSKLEDKINIYYTFIEAGTKEQIEHSEFNGLQERFVYLSGLDNYVLIEPVMKYGSADIPVLTKRQIFSVDKKGNSFAVKRNEDAENNFVALLLKQHPHFLEQLEFELPYFYLHKERFLDEDWFLNAFEEWESQGITVLGFNQLKGNKLNQHKAKITIRVSSGTNWFNTDINVRFGRKKASMKQLQASVRNKSKYVHLDDGTLGILPEEWIEKFSAYFNSGEVIPEGLITPKVNFAAVTELYQDAQLDEQVKHELSLYHQSFENFDSIQPVNIPAELNATLREYQKHGLNWLNFLDDNNFGGVLADDMGLGKSIQVIAFILLQRAKRTHNTSLIVVPTSLIFNWVAEIEKFASSIKVLIVDGSNRAKDVKQFHKYEVVLISYGILVNAITHISQYVFNYVFVDESQNIKNIDSQRYQAVRLLQSRNKIAVTGTPIENNVFDLYAQLSFACPGLLGSKQYFRDIYSIPIDKFKYTKRAVELQQKVAPFILRRTKKQVATELPEKTEMTLYCPIGEEQRKVYDTYEKEFREFISAETNDEIAKSSMHVLRGLTRLRQICNSPVLIEEERSFGGGSAKIEMLMEQIESKSDDHKILVFSQFVTMLDLIKKELIARDISYEYLTGSTQDREAVVNNFQNNKTVRVFLISLKTGGTGLNLTEADYVYLVDPWWNPAVENQAIDRSYRIGQDKHVVAVRLICPDTIEEKILKLQDVKRDLSEDLIKTDSAVFKALKKEDLLSLVS